VTAGKKATHAEIEERVTAVYRLVIHGASRDEIVLYGSEKWSVTTRQIQDYLTAATERFKTLATYVREEELGKTRDRLEFLYGRNVKAQDFKAAHAVLSDAAKLLGLYAPTATKTELTGANGGPVQIERVMPDAELEARLRLALESRGESPALEAPDLATPGPE